MGGSVPFAKLLALWLACEALIFLFGFSFNVWVKFSNCRLIVGLECKIRRASLIESLYLSLACANILVLLISSVFVGLIPWSLI